MFLKKSYGWMLVGKTVVALKNTVYDSNLSFLSVFCVEDPIISYITHLVIYIRERAFSG